MRPRCEAYCSSPLSKAGHYVRKSDGYRVQRWRCYRCGRYTSSAKTSPCYRQNKRHLNPVIRKLLCSAVSQRRIALILGISRLTVARKFEFLGRIAAEQNAEQRALLGGVKRIYMDEMEDRVHTKCKPAAIALLVTEERMILGHATSRIRPKNRKLLEISKRKYPKWEPDSQEKFSELIEKTKPLLEEEVEVLTDEKWYYGPAIKKNLKRACHRKFPSRRAVIAGQGELKQGGKDPLFPLNHTCAMLRANINRLIRRTWCTSKSLHALHIHIEIYTHFHNNVLI